jgi:hypothetical protein
MKTVGFHASAAGIRFVVLSGSSPAPAHVEHATRPLKLIDNRPEFLKNALNLFDDILNHTKPDRVSYLLSMDSKTRDQMAANVLPFGALCLAAHQKGIPCLEFIAANFSKKFFVSRGVAWVDRYKSCDSIIGTHTPNWTNSERLAAIAAWGAM